MHIDKIESIKRTDETVYFLNTVRTKHLRIFEAQWKVYAYVNTIHALWEFAKNCEPFLPKRQFAPISTVPKLIAIRNCMHHNGPIRINYERRGNDIVVPVERLKKRGDWGGPHASFSDYFPEWSKGDLVSLRTAIESSDTAYESILDRIEDEYKETYSERRLERTANDLSLYQ